MTKRQATRLAKAVAGSRLVLGDGWLGNEWDGLSDADADRCTDAEHELGHRLLREAGLDRGYPSAEKCARALGIV